MPRSKRGPALFDLLGKGEAMDAEALKTPEWWSSGDPPPDARVSAPLTQMAQFFGKQVRLYTRMKSPYT